MENIKLHKSGWPYFWNIQKQAFRGAGKDTRCKYFFQIPRKRIMYNSPTFKRLLSTCEWLPLTVLIIRYCFSIVTEPGNPVGCSFEKIRSQKASYIKKKIRLINKLFYRKQYRKVWNDRKFLFWFSKDQDWVEIK